MNTGSSGLPYRILNDVVGLPLPYREVYWREYPQGWEMGRYHQHGYFQLMYIARGTAALKSGRIPDLRKGQFVIMAPDVSHWWCNAGRSPLCMLNINIRETATGYAEITRALHAVCRSGNGIYAGNDNGAFITTIREIEKEIRKGRFGYKHRIATLLTGFILAILRTAQEQPGSGISVDKATRLDKVIWYLEQHYTQPLTLADIAREAGVSANHTCELFKTELGVAPMHYLNRIRIGRARLLLEDPSLRVGEIAHMVGITDEHYFSRLFKKHQGVSPLQHRAAVARTR